MHLEVYLCGYNKPINTDAEVVNAIITRVSPHKCILHFNVCRTSRLCTSPTCIEREGIRLILKWINFLIYSVNFLNDPFSFMTYIGRLI